MDRFNFALLFLLFVGCNRRTEVEILEVMSVPNVQPSGGVLILHKITLETQFYAGLPEKKVTDDYVLLPMIMS